MSGFPQKESPVDHWIWTGVGAVLGAVLPVGVVYLLKSRLAARRFLGIDDMRNATLTQRIRERR